jgi:hypothetical protein
VGGSLDKFLHQAMTIRAREAVAAEFLRKALAVEALDVPELDMMAREAGLLGEGGMKCRNIAFGWETEIILILKVPKRSKIPAASLFSLLRSLRQWPL